MNADGTVVSIVSTTFDQGQGLSGENHVDVYAWTGSAWAKRGAPLVGDDAFGSVAAKISHDAATLAVLGASGSEGTTKGYVRLYTWTGSQYVAWGQDTPVVSATAADSLGGFDLSGDGSTVAVGTWASSWDANVPGRVGVYDMANGGAVAYIDGETAGDESGYACKLNADGTVVVIGAIGNDASSDEDEDYGHARVHKKQADGTWAKVGQDLDGEDSNGCFGSGVAINDAGDGENIIVGVGAFQGDAASGVEDTGLARMFLLEQD